MKFVQFVDKKIMISKHAFLLALFTTLVVLPILGFQAPTPGANLDEYIGQMIMVGFRGLSLTPDNPIASDIRDRKIGGLILFDYDVPTKSPVRNIESPEQVRQLVRSLQDQTRTPLFIAIDQEGGRVNRLKEKFGFPPTVSAQSLGTANDPKITRQRAEQTAATLAQLGINLNFAPVVDLKTNPENPVIGKLERSFSGDPGVVTRQALTWIEAHHQHGILCALKHFPGHGSSRADSHLGFVDVTDTWTRAELEPYRQLIKAGQADIVMTAHIFNAKLDPKVPATLSRPVITGILRGELGYQGVVVSDDMQMKAISAHYGLETAIQQAVNAGVDILVFGNNSLFDPEIAQKAISIIRQSVKDGKISQKRIEESYQRIMKLKKRLRVGGQTE